ncbi:MAG: PP2C family serine/threonine-protein phosphatase, partial [Armatimonadota bacterium]
MICPHCGAENRDEAKFCAHCGKQLTEELEVSEESGQEVEEIKKPEPLPEGALLNQRRYEIISFVKTQDGINEYEAVETEPHKRCSVCQTLNTADSNFCEQCGNNLEDATLETLRIRLLESKSPDDLQPFWVFSEKGLHHQAIISPLASFTETPYDERAYIALPEVTGTPLPEVEAEDAATAIAWAHLLADAFAHLSENGFGLKEPLSGAVIFTDKGEPFILSNAICLEPCDWQQVQTELAEVVERWLKGAQAEEYLEQAITAIKQATNWRDVAASLQELLELIQAPPVMRVEFFAMTDVGRKREHNEDSYLTMHFERCHLDKIESLLLLAVADGMGGHAAGEVASKLCLQVFASHLLTAIQDWLNFGEPDWHEALKSAITETNRQVFAEAQAMRNNMGTTLTVSLLCGNKVL